FWRAPKVMLLFNPVPIGEGVACNHTPPDRHTVKAAQARDCPVLLMPNLLLMSAGNPVEPGRAGGVQVVFIPPVAVRKMLIMFFMSILNEAHPRSDRGSSVETKLLRDEL